MLSESHMTKAEKQIKLDSMPVQAAHDQSRETDQAAHMMRTKNLFDPTKIMNREPIQN